MAVDPQTIPMSITYHGVGDSRRLKNVTIQLQYRHPSSCRDMNRTNQCDVVVLNETWPDVPLLAPDVFIV